MGYGQFLSSISDALSTALRATAKSRRALCRALANKPLPYKLMKSFNATEQNLLTKLSCTYGKTSVISIDGSDGSGKSTLALCLCCRNPNFIYFDIDTHYLYPQNGSYLDNLNYELLKQNIDSTTSNGEYVVLDGVCNLEILERLQTKPEIKIYVKMVDDLGYWFKGRNFKYNCGDVETIISENARTSRAFNDSDFNNINTTKSTIQSEYIETLEDEIIRYHFTFRPDETADIIHKNTKYKKT